MGPYYEGKIHPKYKNLITGTFSHYYKHMRMRLYCISIGRTPVLNSEVHLTSEMRLTSNTYMHRICRYILGA